MDDWMSRLKDLADSLVIGHGDYLPIANNMYRFIMQYGWHPVSEKPYKSGLYFVTAKMTFVYYQRQIAEYDLEQDLWITEDTIESSDIIAWMPLPEPYKPE